MTKYYHLPNHLIVSGTENFPNGKFEMFTFENITDSTAIGYLKLIYNDFETFDSKFLSKIKAIPDLNNIYQFLKNNFSLQPRLSEIEAKQIEDEIIKREAFFFLQINQDATYPENNFHQTFINKVSKFLENSDSQVCNLPPKSKSILLQDKQPQFISEIYEFKIQSNAEYIEFTINCVAHLKTNPHTKYLVANDCNLKTITLNDSLQLLEASNNCFSTLDLNQDLIEANLRHNPLTYVKLNPNLRKIHLTQNQNKHLEIDNSVHNQKVEVHITIL